MYSFFVGCDISKYFFDVAYYDGTPKYLDQFSNNISGFKQMVKQLNKRTQVSATSWFICFENTGVYSKALLEWLISQQIPCLEENALKISRSKGLKRGKSDKTDSKDICRYVYEKRDSLKATQLSKPLIIKLKKLLSRRDFLVRQKASIDTSLKDQKSTMDPSLFEWLVTQNDELLSLYKTQINQIDAQIEQTIKEDAEIKKNDSLAQSVIGIGPVISAYMIAFTENFNSFTHARQFAAYSGIAPFVHGQTGIKPGKSKVSHIANKKFKSLLSNGALAAIHYDNQISLYYQRKLAEGKEKGVVINAIKNKLVQRVFAVIKRQSPYVRLANYV